MSVSTGLWSQRCIRKKLSLSKFRTFKRWKPIFFYLFYVIFQLGTDDYLWTSTATSAAASGCSKSCIGLTFHSDYALFLEVKVRWSQRWKGDNNDWWLSSRLNNKSKKWHLQIHVTTIIRRLVTCDWWITWTHQLLCKTGPMNYTSQGHTQAWLKWVLHASKITSCNLKNHSKIVSLFIYKRNQIKL